MLFFAFILLLSMIMAIYILYQDKKYDNILESVVVIDESLCKNNQHLLSKSMLHNHNHKDLSDHDNTHDEEKKLLHLSRLI